VWLRWRGTAFAPGPAHPHAEPPLCRADRWSAFAMAAGCAGAPRPGPAGDDRAVGQAGHGL